MRSPRLSRAYRQHRLCLHSTNRRRHRGRLSSPLTAHSNCRPQRRRPPRNAIRNRFASSDPISRRMHKSLDRSNMSRAHRIHIFYTKHYTLRRYDVTTFGLVRTHSAAFRPHRLMNIINRIRSPTAVLILFSLFSDFIIF